VVPLPRGWRLEVIRNFGGIHQARGCAQMLDPVSSQWSRRMTLSVDASVEFGLAATYIYHAWEDEDSKFQKGNHSTRVRMSSANVRDIRPWCVIRHGERFGVRLELNGEI